MRSGWLFPLLLLRTASSFVLFSPWGTPEQGYLNEAQSEWQGPDSFDLTEAVFFWSYPDSPLSLDGLGGGITWALDPRCGCSARPAMPSERTRLVSTPALCAHALGVGWCPRS